MRLNEARPDNNAGLAFSYYTATAVSGEKGDWLGRRNYIIHFLRLNVIVLVILQQGN